MPNVTLEQINDNIIELKKDVEEIKEYMREDFELAPERQYTPSEEEAPADEEPISEEEPVSEE